jgi:hypothetical protein
MRLLLVLQTVNWQPFEQILEELGDRRNARIAYSQDLRKQNMQPSDRHANKGLKPLVLQGKCVSSDSEGILEIVVPSPEHEVIPI